MGNQTSQWFALFYLDPLDRLVKEKLRIKYYTRYMDDCIYSLLSTYFPFIGTVSMISSVKLSNSGKHIIDPILQISRIGILHMPGPNDGHLPDKL